MKPNHTHPSTPGGAKRRATRDASGFSNLQHKLKTFNIKNTVKKIDKNRFKNKAHTVIFGQGSEKHSGRPLVERDTLHRFSEASFSADQFCNELFSTHHWQHVNQEFIGDLKHFKQNLDASLQQMVYENYEKFISTSKLIESFLEADIVKLSDLIAHLKKSFRTMHHMDPVAEHKHNERDEAQPLSPRDTHSASYSTLPQPNAPFHILNDNDIFDEELDSIDAHIRNHMLDLDVALGVRDFERAVHLVRDIEASMKNEEVKSDEHHAASSLLANPATAHSSAAHDHSLSLDSSSLVHHEHHRPTNSLSFHKKELHIRTQKLHEALIHELHNPLLMKENCYKFVRCLKQLTSPNIARHNFLKAKSYLIRERIRDINMQGDILLYVQKVAAILFQCILTTGHEFKQLFQETRDVSAFTRWILQELTQFAQLFKNQVFSCASFTIISHCTRVVFMQCHRLEEAGISVTFRLEQLFKDDLIAAVFDLYNKIDSEMRRTLSHEKWNGSNWTFEALKSRSGAVTELSSQESSTTLRLSPSCKYFFDLIIQMCFDIERIQTEAIYESFIETIQKLIEEYLANMSQLAMNEQMNDNRFLTIISNILSVKDHLLTWIIEKFSAHFKRSLPKLVKLGASIERLDTKLCEKFCSSRAELIVDQEIQWGGAKYPSTSPPVSFPDRKESDCVTRSFRQYFGFLFTLQNRILNALPEKYVGELLKMLNRKLISRLKRDGFFWKRLSFLAKQHGAQSDTSSQASGDGAVQESAQQQHEQWKFDAHMANQVMLDVLFVKKASEECGILSKESSEEVQSIRVRLEEFFSELGLETQGEEWFASRVQSTIEENGRLRKALDSMREHVCGGSVGESM